MNYQTVVIILFVKNDYLVGTFKGVLMYITLEIGMISHILTTMFFHNFISPYLVQAPVNGTITAGFEKA